MSRGRQEELNEHLKRRCKQAGVALDIYDPDFLVGVVIDFLARNNLVLTGTGLKRLRQ